MDAEKKEENVIDEEKDASPLGRGADPGRHPDTFPLSSDRASIAGQRGHEQPAQRGGPEGFVDRENEDMMQARRDAPGQGYDASDNDDV